MTNRIKISTHQLEPWQPTGSYQSGAPGSPEEEPWLGRIRVRDPVVPEVCPIITGTIFGNLNQVHPQYQTVYWTALEGATSYVVRLWLTTSQRPSSGTLTTALFREFNNLTFNRSYFLEINSVIDGVESSGCTVLTFHTVQRIGLVHFILSWEDLIIVGANQTRDFSALSGIVDTQYGIVVYSLNSVGRLTKLQVYGNQAGTEDTWLGNSGLIKDDILYVGHALNNSQSIAITSFTLASTGITKITTRNIYGSPTGLSANCMTLVGDRIWVVKGLSGEVGSKVGYVELTGGGNMSAPVWVDSFDFAGHSGARSLDVVFGLTRNLDVVGVYSSDLGANGYLTFGDASDPLNLAAPEFNKSAFEEFKNSAFETSFNNLMVSSYPLGDSGLLSLPIGFTGLGVNGELAAESEITGIYMTQKTQAISIGIRSGKANYAIGANRPQFAFAGRPFSTNVPTNVRYVKPLSGVVEHDPYLYERTTILNFPSLVDKSRCAVDWDLFGDASIVDGALQFDQVDIDYIQATNYALPFFSTNTTIEVVLSGESVVAAQAIYIIDPDGTGLYIGYISDVPKVYWLNGLTQAVSISIDAPDMFNGELHYIAIQYSTPVIYIYYDGTEAQGSFNRSMSNRTHRMGRNFSDLAPFAGRIKGVRIARASTPPGYSPFIQIDARVFIDLFPDYKIPFPEYVQI